MRSKTLTEEKKMENDIKKILDFLKNTNWYAYCDNCIELTRLMFSCKLAGIEWRNGITGSEINFKYPMTVEYKVGEGLVWSDEPYGAQKGYQYIDVTKTFDDKKMLHIMNYVNNRRIKINIQLSKEEFLDFFKNTNWYTKCYSWTEWYRLMLVCELADIKWCDGDIATSFIPSHKTTPVCIEYTVDKGLRMGDDKDDISVLHKYIDVKEIIDNYRLKELL